MSGTQRIIKYLAIAFAILLTFSIISGIASCLMAISNVFDYKDDKAIMDELKELGVSENIKVLNVDIASANMIIKVGDKFKAETNNKYIKYSQNRDQINITEKRHNLLKGNEGSTLIITIPETIMLDEINIASGAGKIEIDKLTARTLDFNLGAGKVDIKELNVLNNAKIDGGAGKLTITESSLTNLDLDMGIGEFTYNGKLLGNTDIDHGVGEVNLNLIGLKEDYQIHFEKGLGNASIDGNKINDDAIVGNGYNKIDIDGGIGNIEINFIISLSRD